MKTRTHFPFGSLSLPTDFFLKKKKKQIVYDKIVNPGHWTVPMREAALEPARLKSSPGAIGDKIDPKKLLVADVGGGTGFCTQGIVAAGVPPTNVTLVDQVSFLE